MLGAVILLMRQITQPAAVAFLGQVFASPRSQQAGVDDSATKAFAIKPVVADSRVCRGGGDERDSTPLDETLWGPVKDNAIVSFRRAAGVVRTATAGERPIARRDWLSKSVGDVAYAQLTNQPDAYRGQSVQVAGRILRESTKPVAKNDFGIVELHQLILAPRGGGQWPIVIYAIELPVGFPRGDDLSEDVVVDGLFFKNWSFPYDGGMGLAPVLVTPTLAWTSANGGNANGVAPLKVADAAPADLEADGRRVPRRRGRRGVCGMGRNADPPPAPGYPNAARVERVGERAMNRSAIIAFAGVDGAWRLWASLLVLSAAQESSAVEQPSTLYFRTLLEEAGVADEQFAPFAAWNGEIDDAAASTISQILFRLAQFDRTAVATAASADAIGDLAMAEGIVHSVQQLELPASASAELRESGLFVCEMEQPDGKLVTILSTQVPAAWLRRPSGATFAEPASLRGVRLGSIERNGAAEPLLLTNRIAWRPAAGVAAGTAWLAAQGFDAALLDDVRQNRAFAKPNESAEAQAFYTALAAIAAGDAAELRKLAREAVAAEATRREAIAASAAERQRELSQRA